MGLRRHRLPHRGRRLAGYLGRRPSARAAPDRSRGADLHHAWVDPAHSRTLFGDWHSEWWATTVNLRPKTRTRNEMVFRLYVLPRFGAVPLDAITQREVRAWVTSLTVRGLAPATVHKAYQLFAKTMAAAVDGGMLAQTPCRGVPLPKVEHEEMRYLNPAEIACLAEAIRPGYQPLVFLGAYGGLRIGELAGLRRSRVDLDAGTVDVAETVVEVEGRLLFGPPKTRAGRRRIGLPRRVVDELALHLRAPGRPTDPLFRSPAGGPLRVTAFRNRIWRPATLAAGLPGLRIHDLRHTAVALWIAAGASPKEVAVRAGHTSTSFVLDRYGHLFPESDAALRDRLDELFVPATEQRRNTTV
jgi:integrase